MASNYVNSDGSVSSENVTSTRSVPELLRDLSINSTLLYVLSFLVTFNIYYLSNSILGHYWGINNTLFYHGTDFSEYRGFWSRTQVVTIYATGPVLCFLYAILCFRLYFRTYKTKGIAKMFYVWGIIHGFVFFFGAAAVGAFTKTGFAYAMRYAYLPYLAVLIVGAVAVVIMITIGLRFINFFMYLAASLEVLDNDDNKKQFVLYIIIVPFVVGSILLLLAQMPNVKMENLLLILSPGTILIPMWARSRNHHGSYGIASEPNYRVHKLVLLVTITLLLGYRLMLSSGVKLAQDTKDEGKNQTIEVR